jgi:hypothetical protein
VVSGDDYRLPELRSKDTVPRKENMYLPGDQILHLLTY